MLLQVLLIVALSILGKDMTTYGKEEEELTTEADKSEDSVEASLSKSFIFLFNLASIQFFYLKKNKKVNEKQHWTKLKIKDYNIYQIQQLERIRSFIKIKVRIFTKTPKNL